MSKDTKIKAGFAMKRIETKQFAVIDDVFNENESHQMTTEISFSLKNEKQLIATSARFSFFSDNKIFIILEVVCAFEIIEDYWNSLKSESEIRIPTDFLRHLAMHTVGTARGILHSKTENTPLNCIILPPINVAQMINDVYIVQI